ncbi:MAG TPA: biotin/lipoyl-binding protein, partial [bacterium]|nr:biotin/lipoyl-binding protein [bacterium]
MRRSWIGIAFVVAALIVGLVIGRGTSPAPVGRPASADPPSSAPSKSKTPPPPLVGVANPKRVTIQNTLSLTANIGSLKTAVIYSKTAGYLETVTVRAGDPVRTGQVVAVVDHAQLDAQVSQARATLLAAQSGIQTAKAGVATAHAQLANARAGVVKARAQLQDAEATESRIAALVRQGAVAQQSLDDATAQTQSARASLDAAAAQVTAAREQENAAGTQVQT